MSGRSGQRTILHVDLDAFFAAVALRRMVPAPGGPAAASALALGSLVAEALGRHRLAALVVAALTVRWAFLWSSALTYQADGLWAGHEYIWSDWPVHLGIVSRFAYGNNFPPIHPLFAGAPFSYHHLSDLTPAAMVALGMDPAGALALHSFVLSVVVAGALYAFAVRLSRSPTIGALAVVLFLLGAGGIGWLPTVAAFDESNDLLGTLLTQPWNRAAQDQLHIRWFNPYLAFLMSQRAYLYGLPLALLALTFVLVAVRRLRPAIRPSTFLAPGGADRAFLAGGLVAGLLPLSHLPTLLAMALLLPVAGVTLWPDWPALRRLDPERVWPAVRGWLVFGVAWLALALPQLGLQLGGGSGALSAFRLQLGWVADHAPYHDPWWWFWLKNIGWFGPLLLVALVTRRLLPPRPFRLLLAFMAIFGAANVAVFQPWDWDNHKVLVYWFLAVTVLVAALLVRAWRAHRSLVARLLLASVAATLVVGPVLENLAQWEGHGRFRMLTAEQVALAREVRERTPPDALFVTGMSNLDPVMMLGGRQLLMGYWGQLWVSGLPYADRQREIERIYRLDPETDAILARYGVDYIVVGPTEIGDPALQADRAAFRARFPIAFSVGETDVFAVSPRAIGALGGVARTSARARPAAS
ncbi:MAG TPA: hypothetical protein VNJ28_05670 [Candidatus Limnocylindrales bacterium]|nr:hypothetical protein [Candidatus Limnocylindrales bacterium]